MVYEGVRICFVMKKSFKHGQISCVDVFPYRKHVIGAFLRFRSKMTIIVSVDVKTARW
jgi:hypothetical protein